VSIERLLGIMARLRDPEGGCPWDLEQDFASIAPYTVEEAYEVADAIERGDFDDLRDELGDLLLQVVFHAQMARERGLFGFEDVARAIADKLERRHPHVFGDADCRDAAEQTRAWDELKARERAARGAGSLLDGIPVAMPALTRARKLGKRAAEAGFDWPDADGPRAKIHEELAELEEARSTGAARGRLEAELGDILFAVVNYARHLGLDPEEALRGSNARFSSRFRHVERRLAEQGIPPGQADLALLDRLWDEAKSLESQAAVPPGPESGTAA
jgi:tetrapyrrole methylase family protein/MazG family protein/ATP diphosphatase